MMKLALFLGIAATAKAQCGPDTLQTVHDACCPTGTSCRDDLPDTCTGTCASDFLDFYSNCQNIISGSGPAVQTEFDNFEDMCLNALQGCGDSQPCGANAECVPRLGCTTPPCMSCICEQGYVGDGRTCVAGAGPPPPPAPSSLSGPAIAIVPQPDPGTSTDGEITDAAIIYSFSATQGTAYSIVVELGSLSDSVVELWQSDRRTFVDSNDDSNGGLGSDLEWSCDATGTYYIAVRAYSSSQRGTFTLTVTRGGGGQDGACGEGATQTLTEASGSVDFTDDSYTDGQTCQWRIRCGSGQHPAIFFSDFSTEVNYDFLDIYDGGQATATQLAHISGSLNDGTGQWADGADGQASTNYQGSRRSTLLVFTSDQSVRGGGFTFDYDCGGGSPPAPPTTNTITLNQPMTGTIANAGTYWVGSFTAQPQQDYALETFLEGTNPLEDSVIEVYTSPPPFRNADPVAMNDDGPETPGSGHNMASFLEFTPEISTATVYYVGVRGYSTDQTGDFTLTVSSSADAACTPSGQILQGDGSVQFHDGYANSVDCKWALNCPFGQSPTVTFDSFDTEANYDFVTVYDGTDSTSPQLAHLSGSVMPDPSYYSSTSSSMFVEFTADGSVLGGGFEFEYSCAPLGPAAGVAPSATTCTPIRLGSEHPTPGNIDQRSPIQYFCLQAVQGTTYDITVDLGTLADSVVDVYPSTSGWPVDYLEENDDADGSLASHLQFTPEVSGLYYVAVRGYGGTNFGDFNCVIASDEDGASPCDGGSTLGNDGGSVAFTSDTCTNGCTCDWTIPCNFGQVPSVTFNDFNTERNYDFVTVYDSSRAQESATLAHVSGSTLPDPPTYVGTSDAGTMLIEFTSDGSVSNNNAFSFTYTCGQTNPGGCVSAGSLRVGAPSTGTVGSGPACFQFTATAGSDYETSVILGSLSDSVLTITDPGGNIAAYNDDAGGSLASYAEWHADMDGVFTVQVAGYGDATGDFTVTMSTSDPCAGDGSGVILPGDGGSLSYQPDGGTTDNNLDCEWHMSCSGSNDVVYLTFQDFDTEGNFDFVDVFDGTTAATDALPIAHLSGSLDDLAELSYQAHSPDMTVRFTTDGSVGRGGFSAEYSCQPASGQSGCVDHINEISGDGACGRYFDAGYSCDSNFCETCGFSHMCDYSCRICH